MKHYQKKRLKHVAIGLLVVGVAGFVGWWGVAVANKQKAARASRSSIGARAPDFTLPATTNGTTTLSAFRAKKNVLLYFNEGLSCQPCIEQIPELEKALPEFEKMNVQILSVMLDPVDDLKKNAVDHYHLTTPLLSYESARTEADYNLLPYSMAMGRRAGHTFVLVGTDGTIKWRKDYWPGYGMMVPGGVMFVEAPEIVKNVKHALGQP